MVGRSFGDMWACLGMGKGVLFKHFMLPPPPAPHSLEAVTLGCEGGILHDLAHFLSPSFRLLQLSYPIS